MNASPEQLQWEDLAQRLRLRLNIHWWLTYMLPGLAAVSLAFALVLLTVRQLGRDLNLLPYGVALLACALYACWRARKKYATKNEALVRLESAAGLHNRLSAAQAGVGSWPQPVDDYRDGLAVNWRQVLAFPSLSALVLLAAIWMPVRQPATKDDFTHKPPALEQLQAMLEPLQREPAFDPQSVEALQQQVEELNAKPKSDWYTPNNLEAVDSLREQVQNSAKAMAQSFHDADGALDAMRRQANDSEGNPQSSPTGKAALPMAGAENLAQQLRSAAQGLQGGSLSANKDLTRALNNMANGKGSQQLTKEQIEKLQEQMKNGAGAASKALGQAGLSKEAQAGDGEGEKGEGQNGKGKPGSGKDNNGGNGHATSPSDPSTDWGKGPGTLPLAFNDTENRPGRAKPESTPTGENKVPELGDQVAETGHGYDVDPKAYKGPAQGGAAGKGSGGDAVWKTLLTPDEDEILQRYYK